MPKPILTKRFHFCAAHQYGHIDWSQEKNEATFGKDAKNHGHNYTLEVSVKGEINPETGWLIDLGHLQEVVKKNVIDIFDHSQIEREISWFEDRQPSSENMVIFIWNQIEKGLNEGKLYRIRLIETATIYTDYYGD